MRYPALAYQPEAPSPPGRHPHPEPQQHQVGNGTITAADLTNLTPYQPQTRSRARIDFLGDVPRLTLMKARARSVIVEPGGLVTATR
jgi:hypothetical protein